MEQLIVIFLLFASTTAEHESFLKTDDTLTCSKEISCPPFNSQYGTAICCEGKLCCVSPDVARRTQPHVGSCSSKCVNGAKVSCCEYEYSCCSTSLEINSVLIDYLLLEEEKYIRLDGELVYLHTVKESLKHLEEKYGSGYGNGYDSGYGNGYGSGYGNGYGSGYDSGYDSGYGSGYGNDYGNDYGEDYKESQENQRKEPTKIDRMLSILNKKQQDNQRKETRGYASGYGNSYGSGYGSGYDSDYGSGYDSGYDSGYGNEYDEDHKEPLENQRKETSGYGNGYDSGYDSGDGSGYDNDYGENYKEPQKNQRKEPTKIDRHRMLSKLKKKQQENRRKETGIGNEQTTTTSTLSSVCTSKIPCSWGSDLYGTEVCCKGKLCCLSWEVFDFVQSRMENSNNKLATSNSLVNQQWDGCSNRCRDGTTVSCCEWYQCCFELQVDWVMQIGDWRSIRLDGTLASLETVKRRIQGENYDSANDYGDVAGTTTNTPNTHASASTATNDYDNDDGLVLNRVGEKTAKGAERKQIQGKTATYYRRLQEEGENDYDVVTDTTPTTASTTTTTTPNTTHTDPTTAPTTTTTTTTPTITTPTTAPTTTPTTTPTTASTTTTNAYANDYGNVTTTNPTTPTTSINPTTPTTSTNPTTTTTTTTPTTTTTTTATTNDYDNDDGLLLNRVGDKTANGTERKQIQGKTAGLYRRLQDQENSPSKDDPQKTENVTTAEVDGKLMPQEAFYALFALLCCGIVAGIAFTGHKLKLLKRDLRVGSVSQGSADNKDFRTVVPEIPQEKCSQQHNQTKHPWQPQPMQGDYSGQPRNDGYEY